LVAEHNNNNNNNNINRSEQESGISRLARSSALMAVATFLSRILGLVREQAMAAIFGASGLTDAFTVAYRVPNMLRDLFAEGAFSSAFVPIFTEQRLKDPLAARRLLWSLFILLGTTTGLISIIIIFLAPEIADFLTAEKFLGDFHRMTITVTMIKIMAPFLLFISLSALFMGALNSLKFFFVPSLAPAFFNVVMILSIWFLPDYLKKQNVHPIMSLACGVIVGGFVQMLVQIPLIFKVAYGPLGPIKLITESTTKIINRVGIGTIGIATNQINIIVTTILATGTVLGAVSWLTYAFRLFQFPVGILSVSIAGSNLVHFADKWKAGEYEEAKALLKSSYLLSFFTIVPACVLLYAMARESVHMVFERGAFSVEDTIMTTKALYFYLVGLPFYGVYKIFAPTFFTLDKPKVPVFISVASITLNIIFCVLMTPKYGFSILALGTSLSMIFNCSLQILFLKKYLELDMTFFIDKRLFKIILAGAFCLAVTKYMSQMFFHYDDNMVAKSLWFCIIGFFGVGIYGLVLVVLGEKNALKKIFRK
jgi:putative peptidoglycan lipid II flippase